MLGWLSAGLVGQLVGYAKDAVAGWWSDKQEAARHKRELKSEEQRARAEARRADAEAEKDRVRQRGRWAVEAVKHSGRGLKWASFVQWCGAFWGIILWPEHGRDAVAALEAAPAWFSGGYVAITGAIWGIPTMRQAFGGRP